MKTIERVARAAFTIAGVALCVGLAGCVDATDATDLGNGGGDGFDGCTEASASASASASALRATAATRITVIGRGVTCERFTAEVAARGDFAYTTTWNVRGINPGNAVKVWDVSGTPQLVDSLIIEDASTTGDVQISADGRWLVVATEFQTGSIVIYDLEDPAKPRLVSRHRSDDTRDNGVHTVKLYNANGRRYAFLSVNDGTRPSRLVVVDLTDPANPREVLVRAMGNPFIHDVFVRDGLLFTALWQDGMTIWDIGGGGRGGSPEDPVAISNIKTVGSVDPGQPFAHNVWWFHNPQNGEKRYVFVGEEVPGVIGFAGDIHVVDISDIDNPEEVAFYHVPGAGTHNFTMDEQSGILYAAFYNAGVRALDVRGDLGDCAAEHRAADGRCDLTLAGREAAVALDDDIGDVQIWGVAKVGDILYASDMLSGIFKLDVSALAR